MPTLYNITEELYNAMYEAESEAEDNDGLISEVLSKKLDQLQIDRERKIGDILRYYKSLIAESTMTNNEAKLLKKRSQAASNKAAALKSYIEFMVKPGERFADQNSKISWRKSKSMNIANDVNFEDFPEYVRTKKDWDKAAIKQDIINGVEIEGFSIVESNNIQIK